MNIKKEQILTDHNTFHIPATAEWLITYDSVEDLKTLIRDEYFQECRSLSIGEGSNLLFLANFHGIILCSNICTIEEIAKTETNVILRVGSGLNWDRFVDYTISNGYFGLENLSLIPGQVGASAIQNIGAYGAEVSQFIDKVHTINKRTGELKTFDNEACNYAYRYSIFKEPEYENYIVYAVDYKLSLQSNPNLSYKELQKRFENHNDLPSAKEVRDAVIEIRRAKLPDPEFIGNAGSFFMNPIIPLAQYQSLQATWLEMPHYSMPNDMVKVPAGWLIEQCGLKGYKTDKAGVYEKQALVLVNLGGATGTDIANLAELIQQKVLEKFDITIHPEVKYIS